MKSWRVFMQEVRGFSTQKSTGLEIREVLRLATSDFDAALDKMKAIREADVPDWGVLKMSSMAMSNSRDEQAQRLLKQRSDAIPLEYRHARNLEVQDEQICAAIERVLRSRGRRVAAEFYGFMCQQKFCVNRDAFLSVLVRDAVENDDWTAALEELKSLVVGDKPKSLTICSYLILSGAHSRNQLKKAEGALKTQFSAKPVALANLERFVLLENGEYLSVADELKRTRACLQYDDLRFLVELAGKLKKPNVLQSLLEIETFVPFPPKTKILVLEELIKIYGKQGDIEGLEACIDVVKASVPSIGESEARTSLLKIRHFFKCLNLRSPEKLTRMLYKD